MRVSPIDNTQPQFKAKVAGTKEYKQLITYLNKYTEAQAPSYNSSADLAFVQLVTKALEKFPTDAELKFGVTYRLGELFNARGTVESQYAKYTDTEPARSDSVVPIPNIMKRILNPNNSVAFNKLMNNKDDTVRRQWWETYIQPIWTAIKERFYEDTIYPREAQPDFDFNFRRLNNVEK